MSSWFCRRPVDFVSLKWLGRLFFSATRGRGHGEAFRHEVRNGMHLFHFLFVGRRPWDPSKRTKRSRSAPRKLLAASGSAPCSPKSGEVDRWTYVAILICRQCWLLLTDFLAICGYNCCKVRAILSNFGQFWAISCNPISCNLGQFLPISTNFYQFQQFFGLRHAIF